MRNLLAETARRAARSPFIKSLLAPTPRLRPTGAFVDSRGRRYTRLEGFRELVKPRWRGFYEPRPTTPPETKIAASRRKAREAEEFLGQHGLSYRGADVLEIGCHGGANSYALAEAGARTVRATDVSDYWEREQKAPRASAPSQAEFIAELRRNTGALFSHEARGRVAFAHLDVRQLEEVDAYDAIVSWETLEHVPDVDLALGNIARALRPGGFSYHEYNPFFCFTGGHSVCTLDFPYGHVLLDDGDFERYVRTYRPDEVEAALDFFRQSLNRMTLADLREYCEEAGLEVVELVPFCQRDDLRWLGSGDVALAREQYPRVTLTDMLARTVWVLLRKPVR